jgi:hypothetical protein
MNDDFCIISFITEEKLLNEENTEDYDKIYSLVKKNISFEKELFFLPSEYIYNIYKSYSENKAFKLELQREPNKMHWNNIQNQFEKDFNRLTIYVNKKLVSNDYVFKSFIANYKQQNYITQNLSISYYKLLIMLCTQSSFYFMYLYGRTFENLFRKIYNNNDIYIVQATGDRDSGTKLPLHLQDIKILEKLTKSLHFKIKNNEIKFYAVLLLYVKNVDNNEILNVIYLKLSIKFDLTKQNINTSIIQNTIL